MNCKYVKQILNDGKAAQLSAADRRGLDNHLATCTDCSEAWEIDALLARSPVPPAPDRLGAQVRAALQAQPAASARSMRYRRATIAGGLLVAGLAAAAVLTVQLLEPQSPSESLSDAGLPVPGTDAGAAGETESVADKGEVDSASPNIARPADTTPDPVPSIALDPDFVVVLPVKDDADSAGALAAAESIRARLIEKLASSTLRLFDPELTRAYVANGLSDLMIGRTVGAATVIAIGTRIEYGAPHIAIESVDAATDFGSDWGSYRFDAASGGTVPSFGPEATIDGIVFTLERNARGEDPLAARTAVPDLEAMLFDPSESELFRAEALMAIRHDGPDRLSPPAIIEGVRLAESSQDAEVRYIVMRALAGVSDPYVIPLLIEALADDPSGQVRTAAAEALAVHRADPRVVPALERAGTNDASERVRAAAAEASRTDAQRLALARNIVLDSSRPVGERLDAVYDFADPANDNRFALDAAMSQELLAIANDPANLSRRETALLILGYVDPAPTRLKDELLALFTGDPEPRVRFEAVRALHRFADEPDVRAALEEASRNHPERRIRNAAHNALEEAARANDAAEPQAPALH